MERYTNITEQDKSTTSQHQSSLFELPQDKDIALGQIGLPTLYPVDVDYNTNEWSEFFSNSDDVDSFVNYYDANLYQANDQPLLESFLGVPQQGQTPYCVDPQNQKSQHQTWNEGAQMDPQLEFDLNSSNWLSEDTVPFGSEGAALSRTEDGYAMTMQPIQTTPGFAAIPHDPYYTTYPSVSYCEPSVYPNASIYPDPSHLMYPTEPYFVTQLDQFDKYIYSDQPDQFVGFEQYSTSFDQIDTSQEYPISDDQGLQFHRTDSKHHARPELEQDNAGLNIEEGNISLKPHGRQTSYKSNRKETKIQSAATHGTEESRRSSATSTSSLDKPATVKVYRAGCKPQKPKEKWWLRINNSTQGETTRTAKIEEWENEYKFRPLPIGNWATEKFEFQYAHNFETEQLQNTPMSARKVHEYITSYPLDGKKTLVLWIQRTPADSGRRYGSKEHSECIFKNCPKRMVGQEGTIDVGHYRVAFDEKYTFYAGKADPFDCAAFAHLYCMERFLDFEYICDIADVRADVRSDMPLEPNGKAAFSFLGKPQLPILKKFVKAASAGKLRDTTEFRDYPRHEDYAPGSRKLHDHTLVYHMSTASWDTKTRSLKLQFLERSLTPNQQGVNRGDLEMAMVDKKVKELEKKKGRGKKRKDESLEKNRMRLYEQCDPEITRRMSLLREELARIREEEATGKGKARQTTTLKKRKSSEWDEDDENEYTRLDRCRKRRDTVSQNGRPRTHHAVDDVKLQTSSCLSYEAYSSYGLPQRTYLPLGSEYHDSKLSPQNQYYPPIDPALLGDCDPQYDWCPTDLVPVFPEFSTDEFPSSEVEPKFQIGTPTVSDSEVQRLLTLQRRQSVEPEPSGEVMRSFGHGKEGLRHAGFEAQPVSEQKGFCADDPPWIVSEAKSERRSARIAAKKGEN